MSKKVKEANLPSITNEWEEEETVTRRANVPVAPASSGVQLGPIVQPIAFVPYNTQEQPLFQYGGTYDVARAKDEIAREFEDEEENEEIRTISEKKIRFVPIFLAILSLLIVAVLAAGKFVLQDYLAINTGISGYTYVINLVDVITNGSLVIADIILPGAVAIVALFSLINFITSLIKMKSRGASAVSKICLFFMLTFSLVLVLISLMNEIEMGYGLYAVAGLSFVSLIIGYLAKK